jgi:osmoprotectant transport system substrate-binding protein
MITRRRFVAGAIALALIPPAEAAPGDAPIVVGSKLDVEGALIGNLVLLTLAQAGLQTIDRLQLGPTAIVREALLSRAIDLYPEYTGNAAYFFHRENDPVWKNAQAGYECAAALDLKANRLVWLKPAPADNSWVIAIPNNLAHDKNLVTVEDFARYVKSGAPIKLAASAEFVESQSGLPAFETTYGFELSAQQLLVLSGGETSATIKAAADGISGVNAAMAYGTDGALQALGLSALEDNRHAQPIYAPAVVLREETLVAHPQIKTLLEPVFARLTRAQLRALNEKIVILGQDARVVAEDFLNTLHRRPPI